MQLRLLNPSTTSPSPERSSSRGCPISPSGYLLLPAAGTPRRARRCGDGPAPFLFTPRQHTRRRPHPPLVRRNIAHWVSPDAEQRLRGCIAEIAYRFNLGADWMNDHADAVTQRSRWLKEKSNVGRATTCERLETVWAVWLDSVGPERRFLSLQGALQSLRQGYHGFPVQVAQCLTDQIRRIARAWDGSEFLSSTKLFFSPTRLNQR